MMVVFCSNGLGFFCKYCLEVLLRRFEVKIEYVFVVFLC